MTTPLLLSLIVTVGGRHGKVSSRYPFFNSSVSVLGVIVCLSPSSPIGVCNY